MRGKKAHRDGPGRSDADDGAGPAAPDAPLSPDERARLLAELEAELAEAERSIAEEGTISAEEFRAHMNALLAELAREEEEEQRERLEASKP
ncbi:MAG: hypothetical protein ACREGK_14850 [Geminicoccales bacterium]